jgi:hypothetical protein
MHVQNSPGWLRRVSLWDEDGRPEASDLDRVGTGQGFPWFELVCGVSEASEVLAALGPHCPGLTEEMLEDLLTPDDLPDGRSYDESIKLASTFGVVAERDAESGDRSAPGRVGRLVFQPVEIVSGEGWLVSCWHPTRVFEGSTQSAEEPAGSSEEIFEGLAESWRRGRRGSAADLGVAAMHELALGYVPAQRELVLWLEDWEMTLYKKDEKPDEDELYALWGLMTMMRKWLTPLNRPGLRNDPCKAWLPTSDHELVLDLDKRVDRALDGLAKLSETLRGAFGMLHVEQEERSARRLEKLATIFLVPTLVVGFYGANTWLPGQGRHWGFYVMVGVLALLSCATLFGLRTRRGSRSQDRSSLRMEGAAGSP